MGSISSKHDSASGLRHLQDQDCSPDIIFQLKFLLSVRYSNDLQIGVFITLKMKLKRCHDRLDDDRFFKCKYRL